MKRFLAVALLSVFVITGCAARGVRIAELKDQPTKYATKSVSVPGFQWKRQRMRALSAPESAFSS